MIKPENSLLKFYLDERKSALNIPSPVKPITLKSNNARFKNSPSELPPLL